MQQINNDFFSLRDLTNCNFESDVFRLLCDRPCPNLLQSVVIKLNEKGIHPQDIEEFAEVIFLTVISAISSSFQKLIHFDRKQVAEIRIVFPSHWKSGDVMGFHQEKLGSKVVNDYSESIKNNILISYFAKDENNSQHLADNGIIFYGEHP